MDYVVAAQPGFVLLGLFDTFVERTPIIAWRIIQGKVTLPITTFGVLPEGDGLYGVLAPDGSVSCISERCDHDAAFGDVQAWLKHVQPMRQAAE
jgi:hypothetical protein